MPRMRHPAFSTGLVTWVAAVAGAAAVLPYLDAMNPGMLDRAAAEAGLSRVAVIAVSVVQSAALLALATWAGFRLAGRLGLGAPLLEAGLGGSPMPAGWRRSVVTAAAVGILCALLIMGLDGTLFIDAREALAANLPAPVAPWKGLLASIYGGITEEVLLRLFALSLVAWLLRGLTGRGQAGLSPALFWAANIVTAILFGLGHLPATAQIVELTPVIVARAIVLNATVGLAAGWYFYRRGLESAMACHFAADIMLHVVLPLAGIAS